MDVVGGRTIIDSQQPLVSIVTPAYNAVGFIRETIESIRAQDYPSIEHIVIDGGSTDGTVDILREYPHLSWISEPDRGQSDALNKGFRLAKGAIVGWLNADDTYNLGTIGIAVSFLLERPNVAMIYSDCQVIDEHGNPLYSLQAEDFTPANMLLRYIMPQPTLFMRRSIIEESPVVDESLHYVMDWELCIRVTSRFIVQRLRDVVLANFRLCKGTKSSEHGSESTLEFIGILDRVFALPPYKDLPTRMKRRILQKAKARHYMTQAFSAYARSDIGTVRSALLRAAQNDPIWLWNRGVLSMAAKAILNARSSSLR